MKKFIVLLLLLTGAIVACPNGNMCQSQMNSGCHGQYRVGSFLGVLYASLDEVGKSDDEDIKLAIQSYKTGLAGTKRGFKVNAFKDGGFDKDLYIEESRLTHKLNAQVDLIETIYLILNSDEKKNLHSALIKQQEAANNTKQMNGKMCPDMKDIPKMCPKDKNPCSHCKTKCQCEDMETCQCAGDCSCPKCQDKRKK